MAVTTDTAAAITLTNLITRVRRAVGDTDTSTTNQRWADAEIIDAINLELYKIASEWSLGQATQALTSTTLSYTADSDSVALPSGPDVNPIFLVEDYTDSSNPIRIHHQSFLDANVYYPDVLAGFRWSRDGSSIVIRPNGKTLTLRIHYIRPPYSLSSVDPSKQQPWPVQHEELVSVGAAIRLQEVDDEIPPGRMERYMDLWQRFLRSKNHNRGPQYVRANRKYRC